MSEISSFMPSLLNSSIGVKGVSKELVRLSVPEVNECLYSKYLHGPLTKNISNTISLGQDPTKSKRI